MNIQGANQSIPDSTTDLHHDDRNTTISTSTHSDVDKVRRILLTHFPYELTDLILTSAQYWARLSTKRTTHLIIHASHELLYNAKWVYMVSDPIPEIYHGETVGSTRVQYVRFGLRSRDQGWGGFSENKDTYQNSYTWFEASIIRPTITPQSSEPSLPDWVTNTLTRGPTNLNNNPPSISDDDNLGITELMSPYKRQNKRWLVQMNVQASRHIKQHDVIWSREHVVVDETQGSIPEYNDKSGNGRGKGFVETLRAGDRIALVARALYPGWENHIHGAEIEIAYQT